MQSLLLVASHADTVFTGLQDCKGKLWYRQTLLADREQPSEIAITHSGEMIITLQEDYLIRSELSQIQGTMSIIDNNIEMLKNLTGSIYLG